MNELSPIRKALLELSEEDLFRLLIILKTQKAEQKAAAQGDGSRWFEQDICGLTQEGLAHLQALEKKAGNAFGGTSVDQKQLRYLRISKRMKMRVPALFREAMDPKRLFKTMKSYCLDNDIPEEIAVRLVPMLVTYIETGRMRPIILVGEAGCGKTTAFRMLMEEVLKIPTAVIRVTQMDGSHGLVGDCLTYKDADAGEFVRARCRADNLIMGFIIDEIDKATHNENRACIDEELLSVTDDSVTEIYDHFLEDTIVGLEHCPIVFTANDLQKVNPILADRCTVIQFPAANAQRIQSIARKYAGKKMQDKLYQLIRLDEGLMDRYIEDLASHKVTSIRKHQQMIESALEQALGLALEQESDEIVPVSAEMFAQAEQKVLGTARRRTGF